MVSYTASGLLDTFFVLLKNKIWDKIYTRVLQKAHEKGKLELKENLCGWVFGTGVNMLAGTSHPFGAPRYKLHLHLR